jgi:hypothetical protein
MFTMEIHDKLPGARGKVGSIIGKFEGEASARRWLGSNECQAVAKLILRMNSSLRQHCEEGGPRLSIELWPAELEDLGSIELRPSEEVEIDLWQDGEYTYPVLIHKLYGWEEALHRADRELARVKRAVAD